jgi:hypothetical protein
MKIITLKSYIKLPPTLTQLYLNILFELDFNVKFPLLRLLQFLSDLKSTILSKRKKGK